MHLISDPKRDHRNHKPSPGSYEWWYFDAIDVKRDLSFVVIFYDGNPFSIPYIEALESSSAGDLSATLASSYPAVSISVYKKGKPIYYSFQESTQEDVLWGTDPLEMNLCGCEFQASKVDGQLLYTLRIDQHLPSGLGLRATLRFTGTHSEELSRLVMETSQDEAKSVGSIGSDVGTDVVDTTHSDASSDHSWNLVQGMSKVTGTLTVIEGEQTHSFEGWGYHDHNLGAEPMKNSFREWYWGRFHDQDHFFVYYVMFGHDGSSTSRGWLQKAGMSPVRFESVKMSKKTWSLFGLHSARVLEFFDSAGSIVEVHTRQLSDNGPFYQRFDSQAFLRNEKGTAKNKSNVEVALRGISEYIAPHRIHYRRFWPLVRMRMQFLSKQPHWVQKSRFFYKWTW